MLCILLSHLIHLGALYVILEDGQRIVKLTVTADIQHLPLQSVSQASIFAGLQDLSAASLPSSLYPHHKIALLQTRH